MNLEKLLIKHEDLKTKPYRDIFGNLTVGIGRNLDDVGISVDEAHYLLKSDIESAVKELEKYDFYSHLSDIRKYAMIDMMFNLGATRFRCFGKMIAALQDRDYKEAALEMKKSRWFKQVKGRADDLIYMIKADEWPRD